MYWKFDLLREIYDVEYKAKTDMTLGIPQPQFQKDLPKKAIIINLPIVNHDTSIKADYFECISSRISRRKYSDSPMTIEELSFLLWCTQGVKKVVGGFRRFIKDGSGRNYLRPLAVAGNAYDTYLAISNIEGLSKGVYRYLPLEHQLVLVSQTIDIEERVTEIFTNPSQNQSYVAKAAVVFFWACTPYKGEWCGGVGTHTYKNMLIEVGGISHQLYLAVEALKLGSVAIGGYFQKKADELLNIDGINKVSKN